MKRIFITGGASDICLSLTEKFINKGYFVILNVRSVMKQKLVKKFIKDNFGMNKNYAVILGDIADENFSKKIIQNLQILYGDISLLITGAAITDIKQRRKTLKNFKNVFNTNFFGHFQIISDYLQSDQNSSKIIINISSNVSESGSYNYPAYAASKAALNNLLQSFSKIYDKSRLINIILGPTNTRKFRKNHKYSKNVKVLQPLLTTDIVAKKIFMIFDKANDIPNGSSIELKANK